LIILVIQFMRLRMVESNSIAQLNQKQSLMRPWIPAME